MSFDAKEDSIASKEAVPEPVKSAAVWVFETPNIFNSRRRMQIAHDMGCDSIDGSSASRFGDTYIRKYLRWIEHLERQGSLF